MQVTHCAHNTQASELSSILRQRHDIVEAAWPTLCTDVHEEANFPQTILGTVHKILKTLTACRACQVHKKIENAKRLFLSKNEAYIL